MNKMKLSGLIATIATVLTIQAQAGQESEPVGYFRTVIPGNSDGIVSAPISDQIDFQDTVAGIAGNILTVSGTPFTAGAFTNGLSYVRFVSGPNAGLWSTITSNTGSTLLLNAADPANLATVAVGNRFVIAPHATLATVFPDGDAGTSFIASLGTGGLQRRTEVILLDVTGQKQNRSGAATYFFTAGFWRSTGATSVNADNTVLVPQRHFILRNRNNTGALTYRGTTTPYPWVLATSSLAGTNKNDNILATGKLGQLTLDELDLLGNDTFTPSTGTGGLARRDELQIFNNGGAGFNKSAVATYFVLTNGSWRSTANVNVDVSREPVIQSGAGLVIRRAAVATTTNNVWSSALSN
ncbi:MAG: hypothetical protein PCFJNLEI_01413 [Verrucomicrobiae bacterium]|nr:hypothetical protein [Verrucomicrobiae bacterium]